jgi:transketolase
MLPNRRGMDIKKEFGRDLKGKELQMLAVNTVRCLSMDAVQKAESGHPGMPMGTADFAYVLWSRFLRHNPSDPHWLNRDRFVLSAGHGSVLLYSLLHLFGYAITIEDLKNFRQWESKTPGHPEYGLTSGVETTTGPLGQGFANGVGMAIAEKILASKFNTPDLKIIDHYVYAIVSDGDLMEGVSCEAASLAGHLGLGKIIYFYDDNKITIEGSTELTFTENVTQRFKSYNWNVIIIDGHNHAQIKRAIRKAQSQTEKPNLIIGKTVIGKGSPKKQGTSASHGEPLGIEEVAATKQFLACPSEHFMVPDVVQKLFVRHRKKLENQAKIWNDNFQKYRQMHPELANELDTWLSGKIPDISSILPKFAPSKPVATRNASGETLLKIMPYIKNLVGGSADLAPSTKTYIKEVGSFQKNNPSGRNFHFGVREHAMGSILNGISLHGGLIPFGATFFIFSDYMRPPMRLAAIMGIKVIYVFTHDSIFVGEDGPTHQPIEQYVAIRAIPELTVIRPADANETAIAWDVALRRKGPVALLLTRQNLPVYDRTKYPSAENLKNGAYIMSDCESPEAIIIATGSEVEIALPATQTLNAQGRRIRLVNMPSWELFEEQPEEYRQKVLPPDIKKRLVVETSTPIGWEKYATSDGLIMGIKGFGRSAPYKVLAEKFGFTASNVVKEMLSLLNR